MLRDSSGTMIATAHKPMQWTMGSKRLGSMSKGDVLLLSDEEIGMGTPCDPLQ